MVKITDFKKGQKACLYQELRGRERRIAFILVDVSKVGRKYVTIKQGAYDTHFKESGREADALIVASDYSENLLLFPDMESAQRYAEQEELMTWLVSKTTWQYRRSYTVEQLRAVKRILENKDYKEYEHREEAYEKI